MLEFAEPRIIRPATENDIEPLKKALPKGDGSIHAERYEAQKGGDAVYLLAVQGIVPVGYAFVTFTGVTDEAIAPHLSEPTADVQDLFVHEDHRNRMVGSRLLLMAETLAAEHGVKQIGIASSADNTAARALYDERGYLDSGIEPFTLSGTVKNAEGEPEEWKKESCAYLLKPLAIAPVVTENTMENETNTTNEIGEDNGYVATETPKPTGRPVGEQVVDFAFGVALTAAEALEAAAKTVRAEAPGVWTALQEKGRPAREKLVQSLREEAREEAEAAAKKAEELTIGDGDTPTDTDNDGDSTGGGSPLVTAPKEPAPVKPAPRPFGWGRTSNVSAEDEIRALENRVKTLEQEVVVAPPVRGDAPTAVETSFLAGSTARVAQAEDAVNADAPTPAESGTALVDFSPESRDGSALTDSAYAITDDEERATVPSQTGTFVSDTAIDTEGASSLEAVSLYVDGAGVTTNAGTGDTDTLSAPAKGKRGKKAIGETDTPSVGEEPEA